MGARLPAAIIAPAPDGAIADHRLPGEQRYTTYAEILRELESVVMDATVQMRDRGVFTLPAEIREKYGIQPGDTFRLVDLDGIFVLTPMVPMVRELAREIEKARLEAGLSTDDLLRGLREQRERYHREQYDEAT